MGGKNVKKLMLLSERLDRMSESSSLLTVSSVMSVSAPPSLSVELGEGGHTDLSSQI